VGHNPHIVSLAVRFGETRLLDNVELRQRRDLASRLLTGAILVPPRAMRRGGSLMGEKEQGAVGEDDARKVAADSEAGGSGMATGTELGTEDGNNPPIQAAERGEISGHAGHDSVVVVDGIATKPVQVAFQ
jgi:hypothetical protein